MAWQPKINQQLFTVEDKIFINNYTGEIITNPLSAHLISRMFENQLLGVETEKQHKQLHSLGIATEDLILYKQESDEIKAREDFIREQNRLRKRYESGISTDDFAPEDTPPDMRQWEQAYINFLDSFLNQTNQSIHDILRNALEKTGKKRWEMGIALNEMPEDVLYYIGYGGYGDSETAITAFTSRMIEYLPIGTDAKRELEKEIDEISFIE